MSVKRTKPAPEAPPAAIVVRGLDAADLAALDLELAARRATIPTGPTFSRNALVVALVREALDASRSRREGSQR